MPSIADLIEQHREHLHQRYLEEAGRLPSAQGVRPQDILDNIPEYLSTLGALSRGQRVDPAHARRRLEETHLGLRLRLGYTLEDVTAELVLLGQLLSRLWEDLPAHQQPTPEDTQLLFDELQSAMEHAVTVFSGYSLEDRQTEKRALRRMDALADELLELPEPSVPLPERLGALLAVVQEALRLDAATVLLADPDGQRLRPTASSGLWRTPPDSEPVSLRSPSFVAELARSTELRHLPDATTTHFALGEGVRASGIHSLLGLRMCPRGRLLGVVYLGTTEARPFEPRARRLLETLVEHLATLIDRARLLQEVRQANARLRESEAHHRLTALAVSDATWTRDLEAGTLTWSEDVLPLLGYTREELGQEDTGWAAHIHPDDRERVLASLRAALEGKGSRWQEAYRFQHRAGHSLPLIDQGHITREASGRPVRMVGALQDVYKRMAAFEALHLGEERLRLAVEATRLGTWEYDPSTGAVHWDERSKALFGLPPEERGDVTYDTFLSAVHPEDREHVEHAVRRSLEPTGSGTYQAEYRIRGLRDGLERWVSAHGRAFFDASGRVTRFLGTVLDITERVREREAVEREKSRATTILESISEAFIAFDRAWRIIYVNREAERLLGQPREVLLNRDHWELYPSTVGTHLEHNYRRAAAERIPVAFENHYAPWDRWFELHAFPTGEGLAVYFHDITERKRRDEERERLLREQTRLREQAEKALRERQRAVEVLEHGEALFVLDKDFRFILVNENQERLSQTRREDTLGRVFWEVFPATATPESRYWREYHRVVEQRVPVEFEEYYAPLDLWTGVSAFPTSEGGLAVFFRDVSERKRNEQFRERLIGIVSHDLRNPLNSIVLTTELLLHREDVPETLLTAVRRISRSADRMTRMITDLLDFTRARMGGGIPLQRKPTELVELVRTTLEEFEVMHPGRIVLTHDRGPYLGQWDPDRLAQVISNLVGNALQHGAADTPVQVSLRDHCPDVVLTVRNQGAPIPESLLPHIFDPFRRAGYTGRQGLGLGLYIVQQIILAHGGTLSVSSSEAEGTRFTLRLPCEPTRP